jgi:hypothetical protein
MIVTLQVLGIFAGFYLYIASVLAVYFIVSVSYDMQGTWPKLSKFQWCAVPLMFIYYGYKEALVWPLRVWEDDKRRRETRRYIRDTARLLGIN